MSSRHKLLSTPNITISGPGAAANVPNTPQSEPVEAKNPLQTQKPSKADLASHKGLITGTTKRGPETWDHFCLCAVIHGKI